jgi:hypothetical protein
MHGQPRGAYGSPRSERSHSSVPRDEGGHGQRDSGSTGPRAIPVSRPVSVQLYQAYRAGFGGDERGRQTRMSASGSPRMPVWRRAAPSRPRRRRGASLALGQHDTPRSHTANRARPLHPHEKVIDCISLALLGALSPRKRAHPGFALHARCHQPHPDTVCLRWLLQRKRRLSIPRVTHFSLHLGQCVGRFYRWSQHVSVCWASRSRANRALSEDHPLTRATCSRTGATGAGPPMRCRRCSGSPGRSI